MKLTEAQFMRLREQIFCEVDLERKIGDEEVSQLISSHLDDFSQEFMMSLRERQEVEQALFDSLRKLDVLQELLEDDAITEIMVNGVEHIFYEKGGQLYQSERRFSSREKLEDVIQQIVSFSNRMVNEASPIVDARLPDGARVNVVLAPIALDGAALSIRKFPKNPIRMQDLIGMDSISVQAARFLENLVKAKYNIFISGGTGSGKTTFLNALSQYIPSKERIITIEDSAELQLLDKPNLVRLETRTVSTEGVKEIEIRDLIKTALRMRPDRIIVGECRGGEALDMLQAMNTGHDGSLSTGHANSCRDMLSRLETMVRMGMDLPLPVIRSQIASGIDILVHLGRLRSGKRCVLSIAEIVGIQEGEILINELFSYREQAGAQRGSVISVGKLAHEEKLIRAGIEDYGL